MKLAFIILRLNKWKERSRKEKSNSFDYTSFGNVAFKKN